MAITTHSEQLGITVPITSEFQQIAQRFAQMCPFAQKAEQVRQNTLAVCAVNAYLQMMAIESDIAGADSWNPMMQMMADVADLPLPGVGILSCRVADVSQGTCYVPPEDWTGRMGYVAVALDEAAHEATLIGFVRSVEDAVQETEQLALERFEAIEALIDEVSRLRTVNAAQPASDPETNATDRLIASGKALGKAALTKLGEWSEGAIAASWQAADALVNPSEVSFAFRTVGLAEPEAKTEVSRAKLVDLGIQLGQAVRVALVIHVAQIVADEAGEVESPSGSSANRSNIVLQVRPFGDSPYLVEGLVMTVLDENNNPFMSVPSRDIDNYIQLRLSGETGESFKVSIVLGDVTFEEMFVI